jgi:hypothetical protein
LDINDREIDVKELRFSLSSSEVIQPGEKKITEVSLDPLKNGQYRLEIDLVSEFIRWFSFNGSKKASINITVGD